MIAPRQPVRFTLSGMVYLLNGETLYASNKG